MVAIRDMDLVLIEISRERERQMTTGGWTPEHDDAHSDGALAVAAGAYALHSARFRDADALGGRYEIKAPPAIWPWHPRWWKPKDRRRDLVRAAALIVAEIERLDRAKAAQSAIAS